MNKRGRPKKYKELETLDFTTFLEDILLFRNGLIDSLDDELEEDESMLCKDLACKFLKLDIWKQNIFIVYLLNKDKRVNNNLFTFKALAELLKVERAELMRVIKDIKNSLISET